MVLNEYVSRFFYLFTELELGEYYVKKYRHNNMYNVDFIGRCVRCDFNKAGKLYAQNSHAPLLVTTLLSTYCNGYLSLKVCEEFRRI